MLDLIARIVARLEEINDGSFVIQDMETERLKAIWLLGQTVLVYKGTYDSSGNLI